MRWSLKWQICFAFLLITFVTFCLAVSANAREVNRVKQIVIILERVSLDNFLNIVYSSSFLKEGAIGLMNVRPDGPLQAVSTFFSLGSGSKAPAVTWQAGFYHPGVKTPQGRKNAGLQGADFLKSQLEKGSYSVSLSALTTTLHNFEKTAGLLSAGKPSPGVLWLAADDQGRIDWMSIVDPVRLEIFLETFRFLKNECDLLFVYFNQSVIDNFEKLEKIMHEFLNFKNFKGSSTWILSPVPPDNEIEKGRRLSWVFYLPELSKNLETGTDKEKKISPEIKLLFSPTTRRPGLVTIADIAPSILATFSIPVPQSMLGRTIRVLADKVTPEKIKEINLGISSTAKARPFFVKGFILLQIILLIFLLFFLLFKRLWKKAWIFYRPLLTGTIIIQIIPLVFLVFPAYLFASLWLSLILMAGLLFCLYGAMYLIARFLSPKKQLETMVILIQGLIVTGISLDLITGQSFLKTSLLGYCPIIGARFYGLGNEFMGIFLGAFITISGLLKDRLKLQFKRFIAAVFIPVILIGHPELGANFGGFITALFTAIIFVYFVWNMEYCLRNKIVFLLVPAGSLLTVVLLGIYEIINPVPTHLGLTLQKIMHTGPDYVINVIKRKLTMNIKLLKWTIWTRVLLAFLLTLLVLIRKPIGLLKKIQQQNPFFMVGLKSLLVGGLITMMVNDSGVVAAATLLFYPIFTLLFYVLILTGIQLQ